MAYPAIHFDKVGKSYPAPVFEKEKPVFRDLSFSCNSRTTLGLIGANGAGKSTCIRLLMDFIRPDSGSVSVFGTSPLDSTIRSKIGYLPETVNFPANLNVLNMLGFTGTACGIPGAIIKRRSRELLQQLNLWEVRKQQLRTYSKGMQQRASFAVALINDPELLILDEPMSGLDPLGRNLILSLILDLKKRHKTILFCSHILQDVDQLADKILVLHKGRKLFAGSPEDLVCRENGQNLTQAYLRLIEVNEKNVH